MCRNVHGHTGNLVHSTIFTVMSSISGGVTAELSFVHNRHIPAEFGHRAEIICRRNLGPRVS
jgi:hypothetical protein